MGPTPQPGWEVLEPHLRAARTGDVEALDALAALLRPVLVEWADRRFGPVRGDMSASDMVQEALSNALRNLHTFRGEYSAASFWGWVGAILNNRISYWARHHAAQKRQPPGPDTTVGPDGIDPPAGDPSPSAGLAAVETAVERNRRIAAALDRLAPDDRRLVVGHYFDGKSHQELADAFNLTTGAVHERLKRARSELRDLLGERS